MSPAEGSDRPCWVLLHPLGVDRRFWDPVLSLVGDQPVSVPDLPGHGTAGLPAQPATVAAMADQVLPEVTRAAEMGGPVDLVGVSLGALVALQVAATRPDLVRSAVLADSVARYPDPMRAMWRERAEAVRGAGLEPVWESMAGLWFTEAFRRDDAEAVEDIRRIFLGTPTEGYARVCEALAEADLRSSAAAVTAPTLVVTGDDDAAPFHEGGRWLLEQLPQAVGGRLPGGHAAAYENPEAFAALLREHLG